MTVRELYHAGLLSLEAILAMAKRLYPDDDLEANIRKELGL